MKTTLTSFLLIAASPAFAHTDAAPHFHAGTHTSWLPTIAIIAAVLFAAYAIARARVANSKKKPFHSRPNR